LPDLECLLGNFGLALMLQDEPGDLFGVHVLKKVLVLVEVEQLHHEVANHPLDLNEKSTLTVWLLVTILL